MTEENKDQQDHPLYKPRESWDSLIRSLAGAVPSVGTALGELLTVRWAKAREDRIAESFSYIADAIERLGEEKLDKDYVLSEEFQHTLFIAFDNIVREHRKKKRICFQNIVINAMTKKMTASRSQAEWFVDTLGRMSYFHLIGLGLLMKDAASGFLEEIKSEKEMQAVIGCLRDLQSAGFVNKVEIIDASSAMIIQHNMKNAALTSNGEDFISWISDPARD